ncbi:MAG: glycosyltransferase family 4 protein [Beduini sp.]|uniref:glycosyltransferase family 4 protein n=1 Tax=Beduini sp. TaxID=1922300 RepID=UPI0039A0B483
MKKKICFIINTLLGGGAERVISTLANEFCEEYDITILLLLNKEKIDYSLDKRVHIIQLPKFKNKLTKFIGITKNLSHLMKELNCDLYISFCTIENVMSLTANLFARKNLFISERNAPKTEKNNMFIILLRKLLYSKAKGYIFQTEEAKNCYSIGIQKRSYVIANPLKPDLPTAQPNNNKMICAVGRLNAQKNYPLLLESFSEFLIHFPNYRLFIFGKGPQENLLHSMIHQLNLESEVILKGFSNNVHEEIKTMDFFVMSSDYEGMPNALMEAMAMGLPCISTDCPSGGPRALIENGVNGLLFPVQDKQELVKQMSLLARDKKLRMSIAENAKKIADNYSVSTIIEKWKILFHENIY